MIKNLVIVESPAKAKTIEKFLGKDFQVTSSFGHIRDLSKKNYGIDLENDYQPEYIIPDEKKAVVKDLKKMAKEADTIWIASDEDREGESIAWHLTQVLNLDPKKTRRIVFHEITKNAILKAIENPRSIDTNLVNAQQARRVLDRLVGFELSPVLWRKVKPSLSAGRVQSVAVRLIVEREREIMKFTPSSSFKSVGKFLTKGDAVLIAELKNRFSKKAEVKDFLNSVTGATFTVQSIEKKPGKKSPSPPFTTSTLQQEASRKLGFSVAQTMRVAQKLYEAGKITYMRTDSLNLSGAAIDSAKEVIFHEFGEKYHKARNYKTKSKGAQEAHEAIRPTYLGNSSVGGSMQEKRLYELIWKRTIASQMADARLEKTTITINISDNKNYFTASGETLIFDGFLKVYIESRDDEQDEQVKGLLPKVKENEVLKLTEIESQERFTHYPPRYTEASLVRKLEELGIGRPSTYAPTISTIQNRGYVAKEDRPGKERNYFSLTLKNSTVEEETKSEMYGKEKGKLFPNDIGMVVNDFLVEHFNDIVNYNFTAQVEEKFDKIAEGDEEWVKMIDGFYKPFHNQVDHTLKHSGKSTGERVLGTDPNTGRKVVAKIGPYGPMVQIGEKEEEEKPKFASLLKGQHIETITLEEALGLFGLPREIGDFEDKKVVVNIGRFGPYVRHDSKFYSLSKDDNPLETDIERAVEIIKAKRERDEKRTLKRFPEDETMLILNGRYGPYIKYKNANYRIPNKIKAEELTYEESLKLVEDAKNKKDKDKKKNNKKQK